MAHHHDPPPTRRTPAVGGPGSVDIGTGRRSDVGDDGTTTCSPRGARGDVTADPWAAVRLAHHQAHGPTEATVPVGQADARTLVVIATRSPLSAPERLVVARLGARLGDHDVVAVDR